MNSVVNRDGRTIFNALVEQYDAYRPHYPAEALSFLVTTGELDRMSDIADIGSGTGRIALELAKYVRVVYAVDTASRMLEKLAGRAQEEGLTNIRVIEALGEDTKLPSETLELAVLAQSLHWMDKQKALKEMYRILTPGKPLVIMWNQATNTSDPYYQKITTLIKELNPNYQGGSDIVSTDFQPAVEASGLFEPVERFNFPFTLGYTRESYLGFLLSKSYVGVGIPLDKIPDFIESVHAILHESFPHGNVIEHYETVMLVARKKN